MGPTSQDQNLRSCLESYRDIFLRTLGFIGGTPKKGLSLKTRNNAKKGVLEGFVKTLKKPKKSEKIGKNAKKPPFSSIQKKLRDGAFLSPPQLRIIHLLGTQTGVGKTRILGVFCLYLPWGGKHGFYHDFEGISKTWGMVHKRGRGYPQRVG
jgi:hypothetical protein